MPVLVLPDQQGHLDAVVTQPVYLIDWYHSGTIERITTGGRLFYSNQWYEPIASMVSIESGVSCVIQVPATSTRIGEIQDNDWRNNLSCTVRALVTSPGDTTIVAADIITIFEGYIDSSIFSGDVVTVSLRQTDLLGKLTPIFSYSDVCNHMPPPGEVLEWEGATEVIEQVEAYKPVYTGFLSPTWWASVEKYRNKEPTKPSASSGMFGGTVDTSYIRTNTTDPRTGGIVRGDPWTGTF